MAAAEFVFGVLVGCGAGALVYALVHPTAPKRPTYSEQLQALDDNWYRPSPGFLDWLWRKR